MTERDLNRGDGRPASPMQAGTAEQPRAGQASAGNNGPQGAGDMSGQKPGQTAGQDKGDVRQKVKDDMASMRSMAQDQVSSVSAKAEQAADRRKGYAAEKVAGIASVIEKVGSELEGEEQPEIGRLTRQMGQSVHRFADDIKGRDLGEIAGMAEDFGRRQPLAFLGMAAIAGLAASRFISASASRQPSMGSRQSSARSSSTQPSAASASNASASGVGTPRTGAASSAGGSPAMANQPVGTPGAGRAAPAVSSTPKTSVPTTSPTPGAGPTTGGANG